MFRINYEVANVIEVLISDLLNETNLTSIKIKTSYMKKTKVPCFKLNDYII
ncbi:hypothetical protein [Tenacibaculum aestuariivivum]|uniref:hypothetical protein n=1 Tax=Tenacibaculum aestuariivivum TaxID=2006131 RepID=UPI003AB10DCA